MYSETSMNFTQLLLCVAGFIIGAIFLEIVIIYVANDANGKKEIRDFFFKEPSLKEFLKMIGASIPNVLGLFIIGVYLLN